MTIHRRIYKRTRTIESISITPEQQFKISKKSEGERFRIEVFNELEEKIYVCEIFGKIEIEELPNGEFQISGGNIR
jgi:hypothetical protein